MGKDINQLFHGIPPPCDEDDDELCESSSLSSDDGEEDSGFREDAISSSNSPPPLAKTTYLPPHGDANGPLYDLSSSLMVQLPIKRGLSKYYEGKSQSFTSLSDVRCLEDLPKKRTPYRRKMKSSKSHGGGLDGSPRSNHPPGTSSDTMSKKASGGSCAFSMARSGGKPPSIRVQKNFCLH